MLSKDAFCVMFIMSISIDQNNKYPTANNTYKSQKNEYSERDKKSTKLKKQRYDT